MSESNNTQSASAGRSLPLGTMLAIHALIIGSGLTWAALRYGQMEARKELPPLREEPLEVTALQHQPDIISDEQLEQVLWRLRPRLRTMNPKINYIDHALRFWDIEAEFDDPRCLSGPEMRAVLTDHRQFSNLWEEGANSLLFHTVNGVEARVQQGHSTSSHVDHTLASLAEAGTPLSFPLITPQGETSFRAMLENARRDFSLNQLEYEWSALVFALYMPTDQPWMTSEGQWISYDRLAERIMRQNYTEGVCFGNHRLFALAALLQIDAREEILGREVKARVVEHLRGATEALVAAQHEDGYWDQNWDGSTLRTGNYPDWSRHCLATGHALEWWAIAPDQVQPPREVVVEAARWLTDTILAMEDSRVEEGYPFLTHAGRALALWKGRRPAEVVRGMTADE